MVIRRGDETLALLLEIHRCTDRWLVVQNDVAEEIGLDIAE
jgi:hypothetical protein